MLRSHSVTHESSLDGAPPGPMTVEEWAELPEDTPGELVNGWLVQGEMPDFVHEALVAELIEVLRAWARTRDGRAYGSEGKLRIGPRQGRKPDVWLYLDGRRPEPYGAASVAPDAVIEVLSRRARDGRRDRIEKPDDYAAVGVRYYWLVDPKLRALEIYELGADNRYVRALAAAQGRLEQIPGCQGLTLDLDALWAEIDDLERARKKS
jgi:Uma2 family endonuclease